jgi:hypothetical protein
MGVVRPRTKEVKGVTGLRDRMGAGGVIEKGSHA